MKRPTPASSLKFIFAGLFVALVCQPSFSEEVTTTTVTTTGITRRPTVFMGGGYYGTTQLTPRPQYSDSVTYINTVEVDDSSPSEVSEPAVEPHDPMPKRQAVEWSKMPLISDGIARNEKDWAWFRDGLGNYSLETKAGGEPLPWRFANDLNLPSVEDDIIRVDEAWTWYTNSAHEYAFRNMGKFTVPPALVAKWLKKYETTIVDQKPFTAPFQVKMTDGNVYFAYARMEKDGAGKINVLSRWNEADSKKFPQINDGIQRDSSWQWFRDVNSNYLYIETKSTALSSTNWVFANDPKLAALSDDKSRAGQAWAWYRNDQGALSFRFVFKFKLGAEKVAELEKLDPLVKSNMPFSVRMNDGNYYVVYLP